MEGSDLTAPVHQHLVGAHRPADDLVEVIGGLVLAVDLGIGGKRHARTHELDGAGLQGSTPDWHTTRVGFRPPSGNIPEFALRQAWSMPPVDEASGNRCARERKFR